jgi:hypothetical protein
MKTSMEWQKLLFCRLTGLFSLYVSSDTTLDSEAVLRLPRSVYYGVGRNSPAFGTTIAMFDPVTSSGAHGAITTPFDTGGLAQEHIHLRPDSPTPADVVNDGSANRERCRPTNADGRAPSRMPAREGTRAVSRGWW